MGNKKTFPLYLSALNSNWCYKPSRTHRERTKVKCTKNDFACTLNWKWGEEAGLSIKQNTVATTITRSIINTVQTNWTPRGGPSRLHSKTTCNMVTVDPQLLTKSLSIMSAVFSLCGVLMGEKTVFLSLWHLNTSALNFHAWTKKQTRHWNECLVVFSPLRVLYCGVKVICWSLELNNIDQRPTWLMNGQKLQSMLLKFSPLPLAWALAQGHTVNTMPWLLSNKNHSGFSALIALIWQWYFYFNRTLHPSQKGQLLCSVKATF